ncbi:PD-(D/E)XK nuclease family protein [Candidatus Peribacteria bacterium]|nr:MAG: PD-(D/E)XK nuclease family protein [Candidatus Peribacteria bacterium]
MLHRMRTRNLYSPDSSEPYPLSRSKLELFLDCPRCFYLDRRLGIGRIDSLPYSLNLAVDALLKKEFDLYRAKGEAHPMMIACGVEAIPFRHKDFLTWRDSPEGIRVLHSPTNFLLFGIPDDIWVNEKGELIVVDYKATSTIATLSLDGRDSYKRQMECYQWLLRASGFAVSSTGYIVYANAIKDKDMFDRMLEFTLQMLPYEGNDGWINDALLGAHECLQADLPPPHVEDCEWCVYRRDARGVE